MKTTDEEINNLLDTKSIDEIIDNMVYLSEMMDEDVRKNLFSQLITDLKDLKEIDKGIKQGYIDLDSIPYEGYDEMIHQMVKRILAKYGN